MSDYLYDGQGPPDPEVERLERLLGPMRYPGPPVRSRRWPVAAGVALAAAAALLLILWPREPAPSWSVAPLAGSPRCGGGVCRALPIGPWLETDGSSRAELTVADIGRMKIEPGTRLRRKPGPGHQLELAVGEISARVTAPPRLLVVDTPTASAIDLGCAYVLRVDDDGRTHLRVTSGWVSLEAPGRSVFVPHGAEAWTRPALSTPMFTDAPPALRDALGRIDAGDVGAIADALAAARPRDTLSLWHLVGRAAGETRLAVIDRILALGPTLPEGLSRDSLLSGDAAALGRWLWLLSDGWE